MTKEKRYLNILNCLYLLQMETKERSPQKAQRINERTLEDKVSTVNAKNVSCWFWVFLVMYFFFSPLWAKILIAVDLKGKIWRMHSIFIKRG